MTDYAIYCNLISVLHHKNPAYSHCLRRDLQGVLVEMRTRAWYYYQQRFDAFITEEAFQDFVEIEISKAWDEVHKILQVSPIS